MTKCFLALDKVGLIFFTVAKQSSKSKAIFLTLKIGVLSLVLPVSIIYSSNHTEVLYFFQECASTAGHGQACDIATS